MKRRAHEGTAPCGQDALGAAVSRRAFLFGTGATLIWLQLPACDGLAGQRVRAELARHPRRVVARLSELEVGKALTFQYPVEHPAATVSLLKLGRPAGGGVGPDADVVAFSIYCTHQGGPLAGLFRADPPVVGPCPMHWTTFDLTRHGMVVSGHATSALPQILLETEGDQIVATGVMGLLYGAHDNHELPGPTQG